MAASRILAWVASLPAWVGAHLIPRTRSTRLSLLRGALVATAFSAALGACTTSSPVPNSSVPITPLGVPIRATSNQFPLPASITPLFLGGAVTSVPYGGALPAGFATAVPGSGGISAGNLGAQVVGTQVAIVVTATPNLATAVAQATQFALGTRFPTAVVRTPGSVTVTIPVGQIADTTQNIFSLVFNAISSIVSGGWSLAGQYGGQLGQVICCVGPAFFLAGYAFNRTQRTRRGKRT